MLSANPFVRLFWRRPVYIFTLLTVCFSAVVLAGRRSWDGGRIPLNPSAGEYRIENLFSGPPEGDPIGMVTPPGETNRIIFFRQQGVATEATNLANPTFRTYIDLRDRLFFGWESGLIGMAFHPRFESNGWVFVYYTWQARSLGMTNYHNRLSRFTTASPGGLPDLDSEVVLYSQEDMNPSHNSGHLEFGPDGYLYVSVGDGSDGPNRVTQRIDRGFFGGILRIDVDRRPGNLPPNPGYGSNPLAYSIPSDNPFIGMTNYSVAGREIWSGLDPESLRTEFYAIGMRNPWQFEFDSESGDLWANDVGYGSREEVNLVRAGANYGWPWMEGTLALTAPPVAGFEPPYFEYSHFSGRIAITGGRFYHGSKYPELDGNYLFCDWYGDIGALKPDGTNPPVVRWLTSLPFTAAFGTDPRDGSLLLLQSPASDGKIKSLVHSPGAGQPWPERLSETGLFDTLKPLAPRAGLEPYEINTPFWSDYALKRRWFAVPGTNETISFRRDGRWSFPEGTIWVKHFDRPYYRPETFTFPTETRVLVMTTNGVSGASYRWNDEGTEAELVPIGGTTATFTVWTPTQMVQQLWRFPSRNECLACHGPVTGGPAGFNTAQLNRQISVNSGGVLQSVSQLDALAAKGYFTEAPASTHLMPSLVRITDETQTLERRVRSYLAANCVQCHQPDGGTRAVWDARITTSLEETGLLDLENVPMGSEALALIEPGQPDKSALFRRISQMGQFHMPPLATSELDQTAISLLSRWITNDLPNRPRFSTWATNWLVGVTAEQATKSADPDGDGLDNYTEYLLRENPRSSSLWWKPRISREATGYFMRFPRLSGRRFEVEWSDRLNSGALWRRLERIENDPRPADADGEAIIPLPEAASRFYRVKIAEE